MYQLQGRVVNFKDISLLILNNLEVVCTLGMSRQLIVFDCPLPQNRAQNI